MREYRTDRTVPVFVTLLVVAFVVMTLDIRAHGDGVVGAFRAGTNRLLSPVQAVGSLVFDPLADLFDNLGNIAGLRSENEALRARLAEKEAELASVADRLERLAVLERLHRLELDVSELVSTEANVIGRTDSFDRSFRIDKGEESGILDGHPVLDENGYVVGRVKESWRGGAIVVPLIGDVETVTVSVGDQTGELSAVIGSDDMELVLDVFETAKPVRKGQQVVTSPFSAAFPPSLPVGEIVADSSPQGQALTARVAPFADPQRLRVVVVVAWPQDPAAATADDLPLVTPPSSTPPQTTTTSGGGDG